MVLLHAQALEGELVVAGVFVRLYNEQTDFPIPDPPAFCKSLVAFINLETKPSEHAAHGVAAAGTSRPRPKSPAPADSGRPDAATRVRGTQPSCQPSQQAQEQLSVTRALANEVDRLCRAMAIEGL